jgi:hypothetical protein
MTHNLTLLPDHLLNGNRSRQPQGPRTAVQVKDGLYIQYAKRLTVGLIQVLRDRDRL